MSFSKPLLYAATCLTLILVGAPGQAATEPVDEEFHYRWHLTNFLGRLAGLFFPSQGEGVLSHRTNAAGNLVSQLEITSDKSAEGEFWLYGAEIDLRKEKTIRAWSSYRFRDKDKSKKSEVDQHGVVDVASGILRIRQSPPLKPMTMRIWSDGKVYPVEVLPMGLEERRVGEGKVQTRRYVVRGAESTGEAEWKGKLELWLQQDAGATPAAILIYRNGIGVLLELDPS